MLENMENRKRRNKHMTPHPCNKLLSFLGFIFFFLPHFFLLCIYMWKMCPILEELPVGKVTSNKTLKRSRGRVKGMKWLLWILQDVHLRSLERLPGGMILKFSLGRQILKDLQPLEQGSPASRI